MKSFSTLLILLIPWSILTAEAEKPVFKNLDVFELEYANDPRISPDGNSIVYVRKEYRKEENE